MEMRITALWQTAPDWLEVIAQVRFKPALSLLGLLLTPVAVVASGLGAWRFGADAGWANTFFIADGLLSHWQVWCAFAIGVQACSHALKRWSDGRGAQDSGASSRGIFVRPNRDGGYTMTETELKGFGAVLKAKATELKDAIRNRQAIAIETNSDLMDQIQHATERELALDRLDRESNLAREVRAALSRIQTNYVRVMS
jgi:hypothetical protein